MSAYLRVHVTCDFPECYARFESLDSTMPKARAAAAKSGWSRVAGLDFCGKPDQATGWVRAEQSQLWLGHSAQTGHLPATKRANKGHVYLSCSCGWTYEPEYKWMRGCAISIVDLRWGLHVLEATKAPAACMGNDGYCGRALPCPDHPVAGKAAGDE